MHIQIVGDVIAVVLQWRWEEGQHPQARNAQPLQIIHFLNQPRKITDSVAVTVFESADVQLIDDCVFEPERIRCATRFFRHVLIPRASRHVMNEIPAGKQQFPEEEVSYSMRKAGHESEAALPTSRRSSPVRSRHTKRRRCLRLLSS